MLPASPGLRYVPAGLRPEEAGTAALGQSTSHGRMGKANRFHKSAIPAGQNFSYSCDTFRGAERYAQAHELLSWSSDSDTQGRGGGCVGGAAGGPDSGP